MYKTKMSQKQLKNGKKKNNNNTPKTNTDKGKTKVNNDDKNEHVTDKEVKNMLKTTETESNESLSLSTKPLSEVSSWDEKVEQELAALKNITNIMQTLQEPGEQSQVKNRLEDTLTSGSNMPLDETEFIETIKILGSV
ncbi:hypothetical protein F8M41_008573 [Gigaspora margarita]|uniref:Uncharacterized protein n=1 Tax=Gigaspora margarita TaxID=4874 RepID=A0A8H3X3A9_GIGMA|nr:hypothetical protein F8M41_008573 [Gigaspora margarita]